MKLIESKLLRLLLVLSILIVLSSCSKVMEWPESPLYNFETESELSKYSDIEEAKQAIVGHYAHYDVVAYEDTTTRTTMRTFIITYGFTDYYLEGGKLMQSDRFVHSEQKLSNINASSIFNDAAVQAIKPRVQEVELTQKDGRWHIYRPPTPTLLGVKGDASKALSTDANDPNLTDPDNDGHPGVTVKISVGDFFEGEIYISRREIFNNYLTLNNNGTITGYNVDKSEQFVIGASKKILAQPSNNVQHPDMGLSPILLVPISEDINTTEQLMALRDELFPKEPEFNDK